MKENAFKVLSIDGGGIRGIIPATVLKAIEDRTHKPICELFDLLAGTSTGGIIACGLLIPSAESPAKPRFSAADLLRLYTEKGKEIFKSRQWINPRGALEELYTHDGLVKLLLEYFGDAELKDSLKPLFVTGYDIEKRLPFYFRSRQAKSTPDTENFPLREVARATSAAPTYFEPHLLHNRKGERLVIVDGGVCANNPSMLAYGEAQELIRQKNGNMAPPAVAEEGQSKGFGAAVSKVTDPNYRSNCFLLSLGTGTGLSPYQYEDAKDWGALSWAKPIISILMQGTAEVTHDNMQLLMPDNVYGRDYVRLNTMVDKKHSEMDDTDADNIQYLQAVAEKMVRDMDYQINELCEVLTK